MKLAMTLALAVFSGTLAAHDHDPKPVRNVQRTVVSDSAVANSKATSQASAGSVATGGDAAASNGGNSLATNEVKQTPPAYAPTIYASGTCLSGGSIGGSIPGFAITGGKTARDPQCEMRENARLFAGMGEHDLAVQQLCATDAAKVLKDCTPHPIVIQIVPADPTSAPTAQPDIVTHSELKQVEDRIVSKAISK